MGSQWAANGQSMNCPRSVHRGHFNLELLQPHINLALRPTHQATSERVDLSGTSTMLRRAAILLLPTAVVALAQSSSKTMGYLGCYTDRNDRVFSGPMTSSADNSPETCKAACEGYAFYGLQYGKQCFCGASDEDFTRHGESQECLLRCTGDRKSICGGVWAMSVYVMDGYESSTSSGTSSSSGYSSISVGV
ncbi:unnamed protein product [Ectocarpus sp. 6 AP-2014]